MTPMTSHVLYLLGSAAPPVLDVAPAIEDAHERGWQVCLGLTPTAAGWLAGRLPSLERLTGRPVRSAYKQPGAPDVWPAADAILVAPATFNTLNRWALGITSTFVAGVAAEAVGKDLAMVAVPCVNTAFVRHPQFDRSVRTLRAAGVDVLYGPGGFEPDAPGHGDPARFPWRAALDALPRVEPAAGP